MEYLGKGCKAVQNYNDNYTLFDENTNFEIAFCSVIGGREEQQDCSGYELKDDEGIAVVCDGMGGHEGGKIASTLAVDNLLKAYLQESPCDDIHHVLVETIHKIDEKVSLITKDDGTRMKSGATIVSVVIKKKSLYWISVGDSRIYLYRNSELVRATTDHNYYLWLEQKKANGQISEADYAMEEKKGEALISFLGIGGLPMIDSNESPLELQKDDRIILMSDGLYKLLSDAEISRIVENFNHIEDTLHALKLKAQRVAKNKNINRDNMTVVLIKIK